MRNEISRKKVNENKENEVITTGNIKLVPSKVENKEPQQQEQQQTTEEDKKKVEPNKIEKELLELKQKIEQLEKEKVEKRRQQLIQANKELYIKKMLIRKFGYNEEEAKELSKQLVEAGITNLQKLKEWINQQKIV